MLHDEPLMARFGGYGGGYRPGPGGRVSGLSGYVIQLLTGLSGSVTPFFMLLLIYLVGMLFTEFVECCSGCNLFPICLGVASAMGVDARPFVVAVTISTAISLTTPLGYQTNMMVYGPGEYAFGDFVRVGSCTASLRVHRLVRYRLYS